MRIITAGSTLNLLVDGLGRLLLRPALAPTRGDLISWRLRSRRQQKSTVHTPGARAAVAALASDLAETPVTITFHSPTPYLGRSA